MEHIQISLVEAYYLAYIRGVLLIQLPDGKLLRDGHRAWRLFVQRKPRFGMLFVAYVRYRAMGWRPRSGLKYGVDWVLYPADTAHHQHSPFCVVLRMEGETERGMMESSWIRLQNRLRLVKNVSKSLIIAQLSTTNAHVAHDSSLQNALSTVCIREITVDRWVR